MRSDDVATHNWWLALEAGESYFSLVCIINFSFYFVYAVNLL